MRFYMVDRISKIVPGEFAEGHKCWTLSDDVFDDHFPGNPIVPGVFLTESMAQISGMFINQSFIQKYPESPEGVLAVLSIIHKAKFKKFVIPGDQMKIRVDLLSLDNKIASCRVKASVDGENRATAEFSFALAPWKTVSNPVIDEQRASYYNFCTQQCTGLSAGHS